MSVLSEESMMMDQSPIQPSDFNPIIITTDSAKLASLNSSKAGIQLRFLQQIMWEAGKKLYLILSSETFKVTLFLRCIGLVTHNFHCPS